MVKSINFSSENTGTQQEVQSWVYAETRVNIYWIQKGIIRVEILRNGDGKSQTLPLERIFGIQKEWMESPIILKEALGRSYGLLSQSSNQDFFMRVNGRLLGAGNSQSGGASDDHGSTFESHDTHYEPPTQDASHVDDSHHAPAPLSGQDHVPETDNHVTSSHDDHGSHSFIVEAGEHTFTHVVADSVMEHGGIFTSLFHVGELNPGESVSQQIWENNTGGIQEAVQNALEAAEPTDDKK